LHATSVEQCGRSSIFQLYGSRFSEAVAEYIYFELVCHVIASVSQRSNLLKNQEIASAKSASQ